MTKEYDLVIIGGGTGGYVAAIRASQLGMKTAVVEKTKLGGTCLHSGCIPSKTLLRSAEVFRTIKNSEQYGITTSRIQFDFLKVQERKNQIIEKLHTGIKQLMKKGNIDIYYGFARILGPSIFSPLPGTISVEMNDGRENEMLIPKYVLIATGSQPQSLPGLDIDGINIISSDEALQLDMLPTSILIIGGGVIGVEWASMLADFGVDVTIVESRPRLLPGEDEEVSRELTRIFEQKGIRILTNTKVLPESLKINKHTTIQVEKNGEKFTIDTEKILVSVGRSANIHQIGLENTNIEVMGNRIQVNPFYQTKEPHMYAIGDCIGGLQLAHVAIKEGIIAVEHMAGLNPEPIDQMDVPKCIYSNPEIASIGFTEEEAKKQGLSIKVGKFPFKGIGKAHIFGETNGFVKMIVNKENDDLLGVHIIGPHATELISEASLAKIFDAAGWEISHTIHPHPTLSEILVEASLNAEGKTLHG